MIKRRRASARNWIATGSKPSSSRSARRWRPASTARFLTLAIGLGFIAPSRKRGLSTARSSRSARACTSAGCASGCGIRLACISSTTKAGFSLSPEAAAVLAEEGHPFFFASGFGAVAATYPSLPKMPKVFETGIGLTYDDHGAACACGVERMSSFVQKHELVPKILPQLEGMVERLEAGARVADVGCGAGTATVAMAEAFPNSTFVGYDTSQHALELAAANCEQSSATNVRVANPLREPLADGGAFDLVTTFDVVHDTPYPDRLIADIHDALKPDGAWLCADITSFPTFEQNLAEHPNAAMLYGFSVLVCMSSSLSTPDGAGLGTLGFHEQVAREMTAAAGFSRFATLEYGNAINSYYDIRP